MTEDERTQRDLQDILRRLQHDLMDCPPGNAGAGRRRHLERQVESVAQTLGRIQLRRAKNALFVEPEAPRQI